MWVLDKYGFKVTGWDLGLTPSHSCVYVPVGLCRSLLVAYVLFYMCACISAGVCLSSGLHPE